MTVVNLEELAKVYADGASDEADAEKHGEADAGDGGDSAEDALGAGFRGDGPAFGLALGEVVRFGFPFVRCTSIRL
jgi:hypothetical protein